MYGHESVLGEQQAFVTEGELRALADKIEEDTVVQEEWSTEK